MTIEMTREPAVYDVTVKMRCSGEPDGVSRIQQGMEKLLLESADGEKFMAEAKLTQIYPGVSITVEWWPMRKLKALLNRAARAVKPALNKE